MSAAVLQHVTTMLILCGITMHLIARKWISPLFFRTLRIIAALRLVQSSAEDSPCTAWIFRSMIVLTIPAAYYFPKERRIC